MRQNNLSHLLTASGKQAQLEKLSQANQAKQANAQLLLASWRMIGSLLVALSEPGTDLVAGWPPLRARHAAECVQWQPAPASLALLLAACHKCTLAFLPIF